MPVHGKKHTTPNATNSTPLQPAPSLPDQQEFHQRLLTLARSAVRVVIEEVMHKELDAFLGAAWGECSPKRKDQFHTQAFERYSRYEPHLAEGLTQMFVAGVSTHKVGEVAQPLLGVAPSASAISRLNRDLEQQFTAWRERSLQEHWQILYLDGIHFSVRHGDKADSTMILTALGVDMAGNKEVLALRACRPGRQRGLAEPAARPAHTRSDPVRPHRD